MEDLLFLCVNVYFCVGVNVHFLGCLFYFLFQTFPLERWKGNYVGRELNYVLDCWGSGLLAAPSG